MGYCNQGIDPNRFHLTRAIDRIRAFLDSRGWIADEDRFLNDGVALESDDMRLLDISGNHPKEVGRGRLQLTRYGLRLKGTAKWSVSMKDIATDLQFRSKNGLFAAVLRRESAVKWEWFVNHWLRLARTSEEPSGA